MLQVEKLKEVERNEIKEVERKLEREIEVEEIKIEREEILKACPECGSPRLIRDYKRGELICQDCGLVLEERYIEPGPEWRAFDQEERLTKVRTGAPITHTIHDKGLATEIGPSYRDYSGKSILGGKRAQMQRLRKWQKRIKIGNARERNLSFALNELNRMVSTLGLPKSVEESAAAIYRKAVSKNLIRGRSIEGVVAAALYAACKQFGIPRSLDEISLHSKVDRKEIGRTYKFIIRELGLRLMPTDPSDFVPRFCTTLNLNGEVQGRAIEVIEKAEERYLISGRSPKAIAAAAIYIASILEGLDRSQNEISAVTGITEVTIRNRYKELCKKLGIKL
ncbi:MAG: transcription initiation factor IIB [Archaeoglobus sp.]|nr:transcription initiation factor IIB [Archaeoglobus sp.]